MTQDEIIEMAREAGFDEHHAQFDLRIERFAKLVAQAERASKDAAYKERNQLVALLSTCFPAGKAKTAIEGWDEAWHGCVYINFPWGQASWHYHDSDGWMFEHLPPYLGRMGWTHYRRKYAAIAAAIRARGNT
jgi:hypothetical protein